MDRASLCYGSALDVCSGRCTGYPDRIFVFVSLCRWRNNFTIRCPSLQWDFSCFSQVYPGEGPTLEHIDRDRTEAFRVFLKCIQVKDQLHNTFTITGLRLFVFLSSVPRWRTNFAIHWLWPDWGFSCFSQVYPGGGPTSQYIDHDWTKAFRVFLKCIQVKDQLHNTLTMTGLRLVAFFSRVSR